MLSVGVAFRQQLLTGFCTTLQPSACDARDLPSPGKDGIAVPISWLIESVTLGWDLRHRKRPQRWMLRPLNVPPVFRRDSRYFSSSSCADEPQDGPGFDGVALGDAQLWAAGAGSGAGASGAIGAGAGFGLGFGFGAAAIGAGAGAGAETLGAAFFATLFLAPAFLADFFGAAAFDFLADFFADFLAFFADFFADFLADFFAVISFFLLFFSFLPPFFFLPLAIMILLLPPISV